MNRTDTPGKERSRLRIRSGGGAVLLSSAGLFAAGLIRGELAALVWGGGLFSLCLFSASALLLSFSLNRRLCLSWTGEETLLFQDAAVSPGAKAEDPFLFPRGLKKVPGIVPEYRWEGRFHTRRLNLTVSWRSGHPAEVIPGNRGVYVTRGYLVFRDFPGLFRLEIPLAGTGRFTVYPPLPEEQEVPELGTLGGEEISRVRFRVENRDLYDFRPYLPGDDPRRLHWKLYARSGELFIRKGEPEPPPSGRYRAVLDLSPFSGGLPGETALRLLEWYVSRTSGLLVSLLGEGASLEIFIPGRAEPGRFSPGEEAGLLGFLAGLWILPSPEPSEPESSGDLFSGEGLYLLTTPLSSGFTGLYRRLASRGGSSDVRVLCPLLSGTGIAGGTDAAGERPSPGALIFLPRQGTVPDGTAPFSGREGRRLAPVWEEARRRLEGETGGGNVRYY